MEVAQTIVDQVLEEVQNTPGVGVDNRDRIGAWWVSKEVRSMGYTLNFTKCSQVPSEWFPEGEHWKEAEVEARYRLVATWESLVENGALEKVELE